MLTNQNDVPVTQEQVDLVKVTTLVLGEKNCSTCKFYSPTGRAGGFSNYTGVATWYCANNLQTAYYMTPESMCEQHKEFR